MSHRSRVRSPQGVMHMIVPWHRIAAPRKKLGRLPTKKRLLVVLSPVGAVSDTGRAHRRGHVVARCGPLLNGPCTAPAAELPLPIVAGAAVKLRGRPNCTTPALPASAQLLTKHEDCVSVGALGSSRGVRTRVATLCQTLFRSCTPPAHKCHAGAPLAQWLERWSYEP